MKFALGIEDDVLTFIVSEVDDTPEALGRVCNIELALLRHYGHHASEPVTERGGKMTFIFRRARSDHSLMRETQEILQGFKIEV